MRSLNPDKTLKTIIGLNARISERFPDSSLRKVCQELMICAEESEKRRIWINQPNILLQTADAALYKAKKEGRDQVIIANVSPTLKEN